MAIYLMQLDSFDFDPEYSAFAFDCEQTEQRVDGYTITEYAVEGGAILADHIAKLPKKFNVSGLISASPAPSYQYQVNRVANIHDQLVALADAKTMLLLVTQHWVVPVAIERIEGLADKNTGDALDVKISFKTIEQPYSKFVRIPPALLKPPQKAGGSGAGGTEGGSVDETEDNKEASVAAHLLDKNWGGAADATATRFVEGLSVF